MTVGLQVRELPCPPILCLRCGSCASGQKFACSFLQIPPRDGHPCCSARSSRHQVSKGLSPSSHFPVGFRLPVASARHGAARHAWRSRGRDAGCPAPPAQIRTSALTHTAPTFGSDRSPLDRRIARPPGTPFPGTVSGPCCGLANSRWSWALAPPAPQRLAPPCSPASQLLCPVRLHSGRASSAYGLAPSRCGPSRNRDNPKTSQVPAYDVRTCMSSRTTWSPVRSHHNDPTGVAFGMQQSLGTPNHVICDAQ